MKAHNRGTEDHDPHREWELKLQLAEIFLKYRKYVWLHLLLLRAPKDQRQIVLTFDELSKLIEGELPASAYKYQAWWSNGRDHLAARAWMDAEWEVQDVFRNSKVVVFGRAGTDPVEEIPKYIRAVLDGKKTRKGPNCFLLADWIRFCRRVGWYFEGVALYEQGGLSLEGLSEAQRAEVEEDYAVCKRELNKGKLENRIYQTRVNKNKVKPSTNHVAEDPE